MIQHYMHMGFEYKGPSEVFTMLQKESMDGHVEEFAWERIIETKEANTQYVLQLSDEDIDQDGVGEKLSVNMFQRVLGFLLRLWGLT